MITNGFCSSAIFEGSWAFKLGIFFLLQILPSTLIETDLPLFVLVSAYVNSVLKTIRAVAIVQKLQDYDQRMNGH